MHFAQVIFKMRIIRLLDNKKEEKGKGEEEEEEEGGKEEGRSYYSGLMATMSWS